ncbi:hypothetical protein LV716_06800 [Flagellimonas sp. HMM57]|uniref:NUDIX hydrolase n=1 Tax=unclassified Flagellimonas TaxID=2644544 RepID=UPI0013D3A1F7|nr:MULTISPECIES: hypothetical protein [unclassified Flagellimonas]UII77472.1 hypothetical protein LV716_06800 [Flagellimonas sp. HMM57]
MRNRILVFVLCLSIGSVSAQEIEKPVDNYTIKRLLICNDKDEIAMVKYNGTWNVPPLRFNKSETYNESLLHLAKDIGLEISKPKLAGVFSFKYGFKSTAALRMFYMAKYKSGTLKVKEGWEAIKWMPEEEFLQLKSQDVYSLMATKIIEDVSTLWGGAFFLYKENEEIKFKITEDFYSLR